MVRHAEAEWSGSLKEGKGHVKVETGALDSPYSFRSRFEGGGETNPEELLGASHAGCFTMALSAALTNAGHPPQNIKTRAAVTLTPVDGKPTITRIELTTQATVPGIDNAGFQKIAADAKAGCPISRALAATEIHLDAKLV
jgi:lipoyl-dependent peroxiredoxin